MCKEWDAAHTVIGFVKLQGLHSITSERLNKICGEYGVNVDIIKDKLDTHYRIFFENQTASEYLCNL